MLRQREGNFYLTVARAAADLVRAGAAPKTVTETDPPPPDDEP
jgi:hypothetical protein